ncbi:ABC transporter permease [Candidatus Saccharibacteria bacterium]|nr:ABC transporter permease [Candidatus Saccharibacteria bacterium]
MLRLKDAVLLARVKLKQKPLRLAVPAVFMTLLFGAVFLGLSAIAFFDKQVDDLARSGLNGRHIVSATVSMRTEGLTNDAGIQARAQELYEEAKVRNAALARQFRVNYDPEMEESPFVISWGERLFMPWTRYAEMALAEWHEQNGVRAGLQDLKQLAEGYGGFNFASSSFLSPEQGFIAFHDGIENLRRVTHPWTDWQAEPIMSLSVVNSMFTHDFELEGAENLDFVGRIPVIMSYDVMADRLGLPNPEDESDLDARSSLMQQIREQSLGYDIQVCYRNSVSRQRIINTTSMELSEATPRIEWGLPTEACSPSPLIVDRRTASERDYDRRFQEFQLEAGFITETEAVEGTFTFTVIGLTQNPIWDDPTTVPDMIQRMARRSIWSPVVSFDYFNRVDSETRERFEEITSAPADWLAYDPRTHFMVEFPDRESADRFIASHSCGHDNHVCSTHEKPFLLTHFNKNAALLDNVLNQTSNASNLVMLVGTGVVALVSLIIVMLLLAHDRREVAIFRAIGYKRSEIMQVYLTFTFILATLIVVGAIVVGVVAGIVISAVYYDIISVTLRTIFDAPDATILLSAWDWAVVGRVVAIGYVAVFVGSVLPILINSRAKIISSIRAE